MAHDLPRIWVRLDVSQSREKAALATWRAMRGAMSDSQRAAIMRDIFVAGLEQIATDLGISQGSQSLPASDTAPIAPARRRGRQSTAREDGGGHSEEARAADPPVSVVMPPEAPVARTELPAPPQAPISGDTERMPDSFQREASYQSEFSAGPIAVVGSVIDKGELPTEVSKNNGASEVQASEKRRPKLSMW